MGQLPKPPVGVIGCDVGKNAIVVFNSLSGRTATLPNQPAALADFAATLPADSLVVCEATGGHEAELLAALVAAGVPAHRADARKVKAFIRSFGTIGKTDAIDARALALYGRERHAMLAPWRPSEVVRDRLHAMVSVRRDMVADRQSCRNRLMAPGAEAVRPYLQAQFDCLAAQIAAIEADIEALIRANANLRVINETLCAVAGVGATTAAALLALMPELGQLDRRHVASLAGLAPHPRQSGMSDAYRRVKGGRPEVKRTLFMAALTATRYNKTLKSFYERLVAAGKKPLVALTAVMRKLLVICNARVRDALANI